MSEINIEELGFTPVKKAPSQNTFNGIGTRLYGQSKIPDSEALYTKVMYFTILYIPVLALGKYLAYKEGGQEYILGKGKLSGFSKIWNTVLTVAVLGFFGAIGVNNHLNSPEYIAKKQYKSSIVMIEEGDFEPAIEGLQSVYLGNNSYSQNAKEKIKELMNPSYLSERSAEDNLEIISSATQETQFFPEKLDYYVGNFDKYESSNPEVASGFAELIIENSSDEDVIQKYQKKSYVILQNLYLTDKTKFSIAEKYALLDERLNQCVECLNILEPFSDKLGTTEASRVLGQAYAAQRDTNKAFELLDPYVEKNIKIYHSAELKYDQAIQKVWDDTLTFLNDGKAPASFYSKYDASSEEEQNTMVDEFFINRRDSSAAVANAKKNYIESTFVVPVALDLGIVLLDKASISNDATVRNELLNKAEKTFLSVQNYAGDSDDYQLYLGQVYYWLRKEAEGDKLFTALLTKYGRSHQVLDSLSSTLRNLGAFTKAKEYSIEAYESAEDVSDKQAYAQMLSTLEYDLDKKIEWLSKSDQTNVYVKGDLLSSKGRQASNDDNNSLALSYFQQSIDVYEKIPESMVQLNNIALIYLNKYRISYDSSDLESALAKLDKAIALAPEDSIVLSNAADEYLYKAYSDLQSPLVDFKSLEFSASLKLFSFFYSNNDEKESIRKKLRGNSSFKKGLGYLEKASLLAPKSRELYSDLTSIYIFMDDQESISKLINRYEGLELDYGTLKQSQSEYRSRIDDKESLDSLVKYIARNSEMSKTVQNKGNQYNQIILKSYLLDSKSSLRLYGEKNGANEVLELARANYKKSNSSSTRGDLKSAIIAYFFEAGSKEIKGVDDFLEKHELIYSESMLLSLLISQNLEFQEFVKTNVLLDEFEGLLDASVKGFPSSPSVSDWKVSNQLGLKTEELIADAFKAKTNPRNVNKLSFKTTLNQEYVYYVRILEEQLLGNANEAKRLNEEAVASGLIMPVLYP